VLHPGVDVERCPGLPHADLRRQIGVNEEQKVIVSVGRLSRRKGFDQVIRCLPRLLAHGLDAHYVVIGLAKIAVSCRTGARDGRGRRVSFLGHVLAEDLPRWYNAANVVTMPNREIDGDTEGFGMVFIEAAACGKPTVAGTAGGTGAAVVDGVTGLRVDGASIDAVAEALFLLLTDDLLSARLGEGGYLRAIAEFSWQMVATRTLNPRRSRYP
jgi:phosphatidylinositol alpha-1,6-mannosyltransferase